MTNRSKEQQRRKEEQRQAKLRTQTSEQDQQTMPAKQAMSHLGQEKRTQSQKYDRSQEEK